MFGSKMLSSIVLLSAHLHGDECSLKSILNLNSRKLDSFNLHTFAVLIVCI